MLKFIISIFYTFNYLFSPSFAIQVNIENKPFVVIIPSYNNSAFCERNLASIFDQDYENYRVIFIDDCSTDDTYNRVAAYVELRGQENRVTLIKNPVRRRKMANLYNAIHMCSDHEIVFLLDGDDWVSHNSVLSVVNQYYQNPEVWSTYGNAALPYCDVGPAKPYPDDVIKERSFRQAPFYMSAPRTFYAGLFKQIKLINFFYKDYFIPSADDVAYMCAISELAPYHTKCIDEVLYTINDDNPIREAKSIPKIQKKVHEYLKKLPKNQPLLEFPVNLEPDKTPIDVIIVSKNNPLTLKQVIASHKRHLKGLGELYVIYDASELPESLALEFPKVHFINLNDFDIKSIQKTISPYFVLSSDKVILNSEFHLLKTKTNLVLTGGVFTVLGKANSKNMIFLYDKTYAIVSRDLVNLNSAEVPILISKKWFIFMFEFSHFLSSLPLNSIGLIEAPL